ncbi:hypothetical protein EHS25_009722 [Saitozyma podzolica]|uniref:SCP2 domain-containing protein n=1 Tax=Saitozyma podzolica TaxID=1890683 RepID=A0A427YK07_9TREE|nr:hypothetical protein EHS25_009722 [Saitozyma podzolica]
MSDIKEPGFKTSDVLAALAQVFEKMPEAQKKEQVKKTNGVFQLNVKNGEGKETIWVIDLKNEKSVGVTKGPAKKPDVTMILTDDTFINLADGKLNGQKAFMTGALKVKGNVMMATKLDAVLKTAKAKL